MLTKGAAKKVTIYVNEDAKHQLGPVYESILLFLLHKGIAGATATRAMAGFGAHHVMHTPKSEYLAEHLRQRLPQRLEVIQADVLETDLNQWGPAVVAGNLPYYISTAILSRALAPVRAFGHGHAGRVPPADRVRKNA